MNILFELFSTQPQGNSSFHGGSEFTKRIFEELVLICLKKDINISVLYDASKYFSSTMEKICSHYSIPKIAITQTFDLECLLEKECFDVLFIGLYNKHFNCDMPENLKVVYCHHDTRQLDMPFDIDVMKFYQSLAIRDRIKFKIKKMLKPIVNLRHENIKRENWFLYKKILDRANQVVTVSYFSKYSIIMNFPEVNIKKISVCYSPLKKKSISIKKEQSKEKFFLLISCDRYEKNAYRAIVAFDEIFTQFKMDDVVVLCLGGVSPVIINAIKNKNKFVFKGYVSPEELEHMYRYAYALVFPSLYEGFGYPPIEAMKYGTLVLASSVTAITEICGNAVLYFNPYSVSEIKNKILYSLMENVEAYAKLGLERYKYIKKIQENNLENLIKLIVE